MPQNTAKPIILVSGKITVALLQRPIISQGTGWLCFDFPANLSFRTDSPYQEQGI